MPAGGITAGAAGPAGTGGSAGREGRDGDAVAAGWAFQWLARLSFAPDSQTTPQDMARAGVRDDATAKAAAMIIAHAARLRAAGETRIPLYVPGGGYDEAPLTWDLRDHLEKVQILVRVRNDRVLYRDPAPEPPRRGRPRKHSADRSECKDPATWGAPDRELSLQDEQYGHVSVMSRGGLHPRLYCRGRFAGFKASPVIRCHLVRVTVTRLPGGRKAPGPLWLWRAGPGTPDPDLIWRAYLHRFDIEHTYRFAKHGLGWDKAALRYPRQVSRWTWLVIAALTQLRLARPAAEDHRQRWERRRAQGKLTPPRQRSPLCPSFQLRHAGYREPPGGPSPPRPGN
jgi:hypothetical protein